MKKRVRPSILVSPEVTSEGDSNIIRIPLSKSPQLKEVEADISQIQGQLFLIKDVLDRQEKEIVELRDERDNLKTRSSKLEKMLPYFEAKMRKIKKDPSLRSWSNSRWYKHHPVKKVHYIPSVNRPDTCAVCWEYFVIKKEVL